MKSRLLVVRLLSAVIVQLPVFAAFIAPLAANEPAQAGRRLVVIPLVPFTLSGDEEYECVSIPLLGTLKTGGHTLTITGSGGLTCCGTILIEEGGTVILSGGGTHAIGGAVRLAHDSSLLKVTADAALDGGSCLVDGTIVGEDPGATIEIADGVTLVNQITIKGGMTIIGPGTLDNRETVSAERVRNDGADPHLTLASSLNLADQAGATWRAAQDGELQFDHSQTGDDSLVGNVVLFYGGTLDFQASLVFDDGGSCPGPFFLRHGSDLPQFMTTLIVAPGHTFTYRCFNIFSDCPNPGPGTPSVVSAGTYVCWE